MGRQRENGEWAQEAIEGVFNKSWYVCVASLLLAPTLFVLKGEVC